MFQPVQKPEVPFKSSQQSFSGVQPPHVSKTLQKALPVLQKELDMPSGFLSLVFELSEVAHGVPAPQNPTQP